MMAIRASVAVVLACALLASSEEAAPPVPPALPQPPPNEQVAPLVKAVRAAFKADYASREPDVRRALVRQLIGQGALGEAPARCAALREAIDQAARLGDVLLIDEAVAALAALFQVDQREERLSAYASAASANPPPETLPSLVEAVLALADSAIEQDDYAFAQKAAQQGETMSKRLRDPALAGRVRGLLPRLKELAEEWQRVGPTETLLGEPDPDAAQRLARFRCLFKGAWSDSLPGLATGSDPVLQAAASSELAAETPQQRIAAGIAWADIGGKLRGTARDQVHLHAVQLIRPALAELPVIERKAGEKRLADLVRLLGPLARRPAIPPGALVYLTCEPDTLGNAKGALVVQDVSDGGFHGSLSGGKPTPGAWGGALAFDGAQSQSINLGSALAERLLGSMTVAMWLRPTRFEERRNPFNVWNSGVGAITQEVGGGLTFYWGGGGPHQSLGNLAPLALDTWTHVVLVRDLTARTLIWYANGKATAKAGTQHPAAAANASPLLIGNGYAGPFIGLIDEIGIWPRALTEPEVGALHNATKAGR